MAPADIDDRKPAHAEQQSWVNERAVIVGPAVAKRFSHSIQKFGPMPKRIGQA
jgi:hypothetical protein